MNSISLFHYVWHLNIYIKSSNDISIIKVGFHFLISLCLAFRYLHQIFKWYFHHKSWIPFLDFIMSGISLRLLFQLSLRSMKYLSSTKTTKIAKWKQRMSAQKFNLYFWKLPQCTFTEAGYFAIKLVYGNPPCSSGCQ